LLYFASGVAEVKCILATAVCVSVPRRIPTLLHGPRCNLGNGRGCPVVVHYLADLQLVHGIRCCDKHSAKCEMLLSACTHSMPGLHFAVLFLSLWNGDSVLNTIDENCRVFC